MAAAIVVVGLLRPFHNGRMRDGKYLGRYTHRIAISNYRIVKVADDEVYFTYKDYKSNNARKVMKTRGSRIKLIDETEFLSILGAEDELADFGRLYTAAQVSRIAETPLSEVRSWMRRGLLQPVKRANRLAGF